MRRPSGVAWVAVAGDGGAVPGAGVTEWLREQGHLPAEPKG